MSKLPAHLSKSIDALLLKYPRAILRPDVERLLEANRAMCQIDASEILQRGSDTSLSLPHVSIEYGERESVAYVASQMPFAFSSIESILEEVKRRIPDFSPKTLLDFGTGPGTAIWAAHKVWEERFEEVTGIDTSEPMLVINQKMLKGHTENVSKWVEYKRFMPFSTRKHYDLVIAANVFSDLPDDGVRKITLEALWKSTKDMLVLVDRGTPEGFRVISEARKAILKEAGYLDANGESIERPRMKEPVHVVAPCSHEKKCPMTGSWCHFSQRLELNKFQMETHPLTKGFEDQKYSYVVLRRGGRPRVEETLDYDSEQHLVESFEWPRMIRRPLKRGGHVVIDVCHQDGTFKRFVAPKSQGKEVYYDARKSKWGDLWPHPPKTAVRTIESMKIKKQKQK